MKDWFKYQWYNCSPWIYGYHPNIIRKRDLFATTDKDLDKTNTLKMSLDPGGHQPINKTLYRTPLKKPDEVNKAINIMLDA